MFFFLKNINNGRFLKTEGSLEVQLCHLYNDKYMIASTQTTKTEISAFIAVLLFKLLSPKVLL